MKRRYIIIKRIWQIILYLIEVVGVSVLIAYLTTFISKVDSIFDFFERIVMCYTIYQILVIVILTNINDIEKDSTLTYITLLKKCRLYIETKKDYIKEDILNSINNQLDSGKLNNMEFRKAYSLIRENIDKLTIDGIEMELINATHKYEFNSLNWRFSFVLRLIK